MGTKASLRPFSKRLPRLPPRRQLLHRSDHFARRLLCCPSPLVGLSSSQDCVWGACSHPFSEANKWLTHWSMGRDIAHGGGGGGGGGGSLLGWCAEGAKTSVHIGVLLSRCCSRPSWHSGYSSKGWFRTGTCPSGRTRGDSGSSKVQRGAQGCCSTSR